MNSFFEKYNLKKIRFFIPIIIIFSSLRIFGYVSAFFLYIPYLIKNRRKIFYSIRYSDLIEKQVLLYFVFLFIEIFYGWYFIKDFRIVLFWIPLVLVLTASYFKNIYDLKENKSYKNNYFEIIYLSCLIYFIFYFVMNVFAYLKYGAFFRIQDYLWIGSSSAFSISSIFFYAISQIWQKRDFKVISFLNLSFIFYIFLVLINDTRLGIVYIAVFLIYLVIKNIQLKKYLNSFLLTFTTLLSYTILSFFINQFHIRFSDGFVFTNSNYVNDILERNLIQDSKNIFMKDNRKKEFFNGLRKFDEYPTLNKIIGTGWYSSRITINLDAVDIKPVNFLDKKVSYLQGIVAVILDTGILGSAFLFYLFLINIFTTFTSREELIKKLFFVSLLVIAFLGLFIGYPLVNIAYILFLVPSGIIQDGKK